MIQEKSLNESVWISIKFGKSRTSLILENYDGSDVSRIERHVLPKFLAPFPY